jgi:cytidine deaminase
MDDERLLALAREGMERAYSPYSGYRVGAALLASDGSVVTGCNVENVSYGLTVCAERNAVARAVAEGKRSFTTIAITTDGSAAIQPCGACRQVLAEFAPDLRVVSQGRETRDEWSLRELLPEPFEAPPEWRARKDEEGR